MVMTMLRAAMFLAALVCMIDMSASSHKAHRVAVHATRH
jgi:hypothetical protein